MEDLDNMAHNKACKSCKFIFDGNKCPQCGSEEFSENYKGSVKILDSDKSEIAKNLKIAKKGSFALKS